MLLKTDAVDVIILIPKIQYSYLISFKGAVPDLE